MKKMSINEAAKYFGISKEAIHNRVRRGSLNSVVEDGIKMVIVDDTRAKKTVVSKTHSNAKSNDERYYKLLEEQNARLQARVETLEGETRTLRDQKELMLIEERKKIEQIYKEKDEQLKNILSTISSQFILSSPQEEEIELIEPVDVEVQESDPISLKKYLKMQKYSSKKVKKIQARFEKRAKKDERITTIGSKIYIDTLRFDYEDLIK
jgi:predicted DNA-binding protein YlxM (UPF0122 family)